MNALATKANYFILSNTNTPFLLEIAISMAPSFVMSSAAMFKPEPELLSISCAVNVVSAAPTSLTTSS